MRGVEGGGNWPVLHYHRSDAICFVCGGAGRCVCVFFCSQLQIHIDVLFSQWLLLVVLTSNCPCTYLVHGGEAIVHARMDTALMCLDELLSVHHREFTWVWLAVRPFQLVYRRILANLTHGCCNEAPRCDTTDGLCNLTRVDSWTGVRTIKVVECRTPVRDPIRCPFSMHFPEESQWFPIKIARPPTEYDALFRTHFSGDAPWDSMQVCGRGDDVFVLGYFLSPGTMYICITCGSKLGISGSQRVDAQWKFKHTEPFAFR